MREKEKRSPGPPTKGFLEDPNVREWYETLRLQSTSTARGYLAHMARVWRHTGLSPAEFVDGDQLELDRRGQRFLNDFQALRQADGSRLSEAYLKCYCTAMVSWLDWNGKAFKRKLRIGRAPRKPRASKQFIPTSEQLRRVLDAASPRTRATIALMALAGLRPEVQGSDEGDRGLMVQSVEGLGRDEAGRFVVDVLPLRIEVEDDSSKNGCSFFTFMGAEGASYLVAYLNSRVAAGEEVGPMSPLICRVKFGRHASSSKFLKTLSITHHVRRVHKSVGLPLPPYIWRSYFDTHMMLAESKGCLIRDYREFFMGHRGDIEAEYTVRKSLPPSVVEDMAQKFMESMKYLETRHDAAKDDAAQEVLKTILRGLQVTDEDLAELDLDDPEPGRLEAVIQARVAALAQAQAVAPAPVAAAAPVPSGPRQRLVDVGAVGQWLENGWTWAYNAPVPPGKALLEAPSGSAVEVQGGPVAA